MSYSESYRPYGGPDTHGDDPSKLFNESDYEAYKIFAGGLNRSTTAETLRNYFSKYGTVVHSEIVADKTTGRSRGFGFVTFSNDAALKAVLAVSHKIDNVLADVKQAIKKERARDLLPTREEVNRIFVGGIADNISEDEFKDYFGKYGSVLNYNFIVDKSTNKPRGFGFVVYEDPADVDKAIGHHTKLGRNCEAKRAQPRPSSGKNMQPSNRDNFDYAAYYYAQANMMYNPYFAQMFANGQVPFFNSMYPYNWQNDEAGADDGQPSHMPGEDESRTGRDKRYQKPSDHYSTGPARGGQRKLSRAEPY
ncbi:RNA recognition motif domain containing protein [Babesia bovis T2Bo]|uniref:Ribonucleoprotein, putative n=1 Tax=Babesia bovis TaxID=5865 RepID=A7ART3_BABBO|nr:RNA recognition motif domain containing protein [Babesia bovis T2Bo]EDO07252.1 RNA recognition motif domain containing protein [Babesia bovis T2Bo]|eukprot:XP_001610820.1 ribonucleoprotein [Babesia bovis T2Bo]